MVRAVQLRCYVVVTDSGELFAANCPGRDGAQHVSTVASRIELHPEGSWRERNGCVETSPVLRKPCWLRHQAHHA